MLSKKKKTILGVACCGPADGYPFGQLFDDVQDITTKGFEGIDMLLLYGGTDIHPSFYREGHGRFNQAPTFPSKRDDLEHAALKYCKVHNIPSIGLCRGAQLQCAFAGGRLVQHTTGHANGNHQLVTKDGEIMQTNSLHHQMMYPYDINHELLAWSYPKHSKVYLDGTNDEIVTMHDKEEPEIVYFPGINGLAIQGHPEYPSAPMKFHDYCVSLAKRYFNLKEVK